MFIKIERTHEPTVLVEGNRVTVTSAAGMFEVAPGGGLREKPQVTQDFTLNAASAELLRIQAAAVAAYRGVQVEPGATCDYSPGALTVSIDGLGPVHLQIQSMSDRFVGPAETLCATLNKLAERGILLAETDLSLE